MHNINNNLYEETAIKDAEKRTEKYKSEKKMKEIRLFLNSRLFKDLDFPLDEDELDDEITEF